MIGIVPLLAALGLAALFVMLALITNGAISIGPLVLVDGNRYEVRLLPRVAAGLEVVTADGPAEESAPEGDES